MIKTEDNTISFAENGVQYEGVIQWSAGAAGAGFHVQMTKPVAVRTEGCRYYSTHEGVLRKERPEEIARQLMREAYIKHKSI